MAAKKSIGVDIVEKWWVKEIASEWSRRHCVKWMAGPLNLTPICHFVKHGLFRSHFKIPQIGTSLNPPWHSWNIATHWKSPSYPPKHQTQRILCNISYSGALTWKNESKIWGWCRLVMEVGGGHITPFSDWFSVSQHLYKRPFSWFNFPFSL